MDRQACLALDEADPLCALADHFDVPDGVVISEIMHHPRGIPGTPLVTITPRGSANGCGTTGITWNA